MENLHNQPTTSRIEKPFWVIWSVELWERFGFYGIQAIITLYFVKQLGYTEAQSFYVFGSFTALSYAFVWIGGWIGDKYLGAKCTMVLGTTFLMFSYAALGFSNSHTIFYALAGIVIGGALFKANPASLISKMYAKDNATLDGAMTLYYVAVNIGSLVSMSLTPIIAQKYGWSYAFWLCALGLFFGLLSYALFKKLLINIGTPLDNKPVNYFRAGLTTIGSLIMILVVTQLLNHTTISNWIVYSIVSLGFVYFLKIAISLEGIARLQMLVAFVLILQGVLFFVLYYQMPTSLVFFAVHNINNHFWGWSISPAQYQVLNPLVILLMSPFLVRLYRTHPATHVTKFCIGMTLCASAFLVLNLPQYFNTNGLASPWWMVLTYFLQSTGELLISGLGLAMVAALCPKSMTGFVMGIWMLTNMLAGPIAAWLAGMTAPTSAETLSAVASMSVYSHVFTEIGLFTSAIALIMWVSRPMLNRLLVQKN
ncbi:MAG: oligopeptide:H+ symporter [Gammaproteobacteria bacterium]|nr:oligopeptide:H+ symporter [Gammaproteobacteria bacterium]